MGHASSPGKSIGCSSRILESSQKIDEHSHSEVTKKVVKKREGGSILELLEEMIKVGQTMGFSMDGCNKDLEKIIGSKAKKDWIRELTIKHKVSFLTLQETKMESILTLDIKLLWGNSNFDFIFSEALGNSGGILCAWDHNVFRKEHHTISDNFVALFGSWIPNQMKTMFISVYAPQAGSNKRILWSYLETLVNRWNGECVIMGDFNEVRRMEERWGSSFNVNDVRRFNNFIFNAGLVDFQLEGYSFTWAHHSATKMSKLDRFLVSHGFISCFPYISAVCLDRHLSDHRPILLREVFTDYGATPFHLYHSWFSFQGFDQMVSHVWHSICLNYRNDMIRFKKKLQILKKELHVFVTDMKKKQMGCVNELKTNLSDIDTILDQVGISDDILLARTEYMNLLLDTKAAVGRDYIQKAKIKWVVEGDENSKNFHGIVNRKRASLAVKGIMVDGDWVDDPSRVKNEFRDHFNSRFQDPGTCHGKLNFTFPNRLTSDQETELENPISKDEIRDAVWGCGENISPGPDGFTFEFFRKYWQVVGIDFCLAVEWFFDHASFAIGCYSSFIALISKSLDLKFVNDFRPINLIGARCRVKNQCAMVFKVDFAKAYDSIRWDYLIDVIHSFRFGAIWCSWIRGCLTSSMASILVNGSPTFEFQFHRGLKQGDPLAPYLFILVMESLHLSFTRIIDAGMFTGVMIDSSVMISHLFYADDTVFIGEWSQKNFKGIMYMLHCFSILSGLSINIMKSHLLGVGIPSSQVLEAASSMGCLVMKAPFKYLGVNVGGNSALVKSWDETINKLMMRLSKWNFFNGAQDDERKIACVKWAKVLASKKYRGLGVSSFYALNRALLLKWVWRLLSRDLSLWSRYIYASHCSNGQKPSAAYSSNWSSISRKGGVESSQLEHVQDILGSIILSNSEGRWIWDMSGDGEFRVKDVRNLLDETFLPKLGFGSFSQELYLCQVYYVIVADVLDELEETHDKMNGSIIFNLMHKINVLKQDELYVPNYYQKRNSVWRDFDILTLTPACTCVAHEGSLRTFLNFYTKDVLEDVRRVSGRVADNARQKKDHIENRMIADIMTFAYLYRTPTNIFVFTGNVKLAGMILSLKTKVTKMIVGLSLSATRAKTRLLRNAATKLFECPNRWES
uniref:Reverse transcriptase domain-containing protein n=1 Tax=Tanacetum cinerariifolium TaxID=118510 RepID=A0A6L2JC53_TANCI|nr:hypothetical protein [Tanacetum cinerariifolium]